MEETRTVTVHFTVTPALLAAFDAAVKSAHITSRSAALTEAMRDLILKLKRHARQ